MKWKAISFFLIITIILVKLVLVPIRESRDILRVVEVTAHRGYSEKYPENTMIAFEKAHEYGADWIELDVQETKDGKLIVIHNNDFRETAGVKKNVWDVTYEEAKTFNVGAYMEKEAYVPTLEEVLIWAKENNVKLNIELKDNEHSLSLVASTLDLVNKYNYKKNVVIASMNYDFLTEVKKIDKTFETVYVTKELEKPVVEYTAADNFSIRKTALTEELVKEIHDNNKKIYVWTIIAIDEIVNAIDYKVDNIIVNDVELGLDIKEQLVRYGG